MASAYYLSISYLFVIELRAFLLASKVELFHRFHTCSIPREAAQTMVPLWSNWEHWFWWGGQEDNQWRTRCSWSRTQWFGCPLRLETLWDKKYWGWMCSLNQNFYANLNTEHIQMIFNSLFRIMSQSFWIWEQLIHKHKNPMAEEREITRKNQFIINRKANESHGCPKIFLSDIKSCFFLLSKVFIVSRRKSCYLSNVVFIIL